MTRFLTAALATVVIALALWPIVGLERIVNDHEVGVMWQPFLKHRLTSRVVFENPALRGLQIIPLEDLTSTEREAFANYCAVRFDANSLLLCLQRTMDRLL